MLSDSNIGHGCYWGKKVKLERDVCLLDKIDTFEILALLNAKFLRNASDEFSF